MNQTMTTQQLRELRLDGMADHYESVTALPMNKQPEKHQLVAGLVEAERLHRRHYRTTMFLKLSKLRYSAMLEDLNYGPARNLSKEQIAALADCSYINRAENILISGATGSGKSFLACALGHQACVMGHKTAYLNLNRFADKVLHAKLDGTFVKLLNQLQKVSLIILDDFGLAPIDANTRLALLQILEDHYARKSIIIASQLPIGKWYEAIAEPTLADAIMDRLLSNAHRFELRGESLRKTKALKN